MPNFDGDSADNALIGSSGADQLRGFGGHDILNGNGGADTLRGGAGNDIYITDGGDVLIELANEGIDEVRASVNTVLGTNFENLTLTGSAAINGNGNNGDNVLAGNAGNNILNGRAGIDTLQMTREPGYTGVTDVHLGNGIASGHGNDTLLNIENVRGSAQRDRIWGSAGNNLIDGGDGDDQIHATAGVDSLLGGGGTDVLRFQDVGAVGLDLAAGTYTLAAGGSGTLAGFEQLIGSMHDDHMIGDGQANALSGARGNDTLIGGGGHDELWGGPGSDRLVADGGNDRLIGHNELGGVLVGGTSDGVGNVFEVRPTAGFVTVADFHAGLDKLDLVSFGLGTPGSAWTGTGSHSGADTLLQLTDGQGQLVSILLEGVDAGDRLALADFIGGTAALVPVIAPPPPPPVLGNGVADVFVIDPQDIIDNHNGVLDIHGFEDGLDLLDVTAMDASTSTYWWASLYGEGPFDQARLEFTGQGGECFSVNLVGVNYMLVGYDDLIM